MKKFVFRIIEREPLREMYTNRRFTDRELYYLDGIRKLYADVLASTEEEALERLNQHWDYWNPGVEIEPELLMIV